MDEGRRWRIVRGSLLALAVLAAVLFAWHARGSSLAGFHWIPLALLAVGLLHALQRRIRAAWKATALRKAQRARRPGPDEPLGRLARGYGLDARTFIVGASAPNACFSLGLRKPCVYVADDLLHLLEPLELEAVFRHEAFHVRRRDPLRFATVRFLADTLFWLPIVGDLAVRLEEEAEVRADEVAGRDASALASALVKVAERSQSLLRPIAPVGATPLLGRRVRRLVGERYTLPALIRPRSAVVSGLGLALLMACTAVLPDGRVAPIDSAWACVRSTAPCCECVADARAGNAAFAPLIPSSTRQEIGDEILDVPLG